MTLDDLIAEQSPILWPDGEGENLIAAHRAFYQEGLWSLNKWIDCYRFNHQDVFDHCATYFNCGMTVLPMVPGSISQIYVIDRVNPETGQEDPTAKSDWCRKVYYHQVDYCHLEQAVRLCQRCSSTSTVAVADAIISGMFGIFRRKRRYPAPTDEGLPPLPPLPGGFHYPQTSTDASGRSPSGVWAIKGGRIYISPWIQSTETVVIEWTGVKSKWSGLDTVEDDIKFKEAIRLFVGWKHESTYGEPSKASDLKDQLFGNPNLAIPGAIPELIHECREQTRVRTCEGAGSGQAAAARGIGTGSGGAVYSNDQQYQYTAQCPQGQTGDDVTVTVAAGTVQSALSVADANAKAQQKAQTDAQAILVCDSAVTTYYNTPQTATVTCPGATGDTPAAIGPSVTVTVQAKAFSSTVSQEAADAAALSRAEDLARAQLHCTYYNAPQTQTASCPEGSTGDDQEATVAAGEFTSTTSQTDADAKAQQEAQKRAVALLVCTGDTYLVGNTLQTVRYQTVCAPSGCVPRLFVGEGRVPANTYTALTTAAKEAETILGLNLQAQTAATEAAHQAFDAACRTYMAQCLAH